MVLLASSVWRRARWSLFCTAPAPLGVGGSGVDDGGGAGCGSLPPTGGDITTTSGTDYTTTATATSDSDGERRHRDFHHLAVLTAPVVEEGEEHAEEEEMEKERAMKVKLGHLKSLVVEEGEEHAEEEEMEKERAMKVKLGQLKSLVVEFDGGDLSATETWLHELHVGWVHHLTDETDEFTAWRRTLVSQRLRFYARVWILAVHEISKSISACLDGWRCQERQDEGTSKHPPPASGFLRFVEATVSKMLPFVDVAAATTTGGRPGAVAEDKLEVLVELHEAFSMASEQIRTVLPEPDCTMRGLLSSELTKLDKAIWDTTVEIRNSLMAWTCSGGIDRLDPSGIHKITYSVISYTKVLWANYTSVNLILHDALLRGEYVPEDESVSHVASLITEIVRSTEEQLATKSLWWFPDQSLRFLFLINNCYFILEQLQTICLYTFRMPTITRKIDDYIDCYLQVSWAPVLKCLHDPAAAPRCFISTTCSPLTRFESGFQKTYAAQKLLKVPDPEMRRRLRKAIVDKVVPILTRCFEDNSIDIDTTGVTPNKVEEMLRELFEG